MSAIVIYKSQTGLTKKYAEWISQASGCQCLDFKKARKLDLTAYDTIIFGGWCMAGGITKLDWFKNQISSLADAGKKLIVYAVGASPAESPEIAEAMRQNFSEDEWKKVKVFYCPGGLDYNKMKLGSRLAMKMFVRILSSKKDVSQKDLCQIEMLSHSYDLTDKKYIEPILAEIN
ncbi:MAG: flavodoxin domain-containing protein [Treponema sp.]|nr:flavodoxin domain-containing protein [Treponema sp.]